MIIAIKDFLSDRRFPWQWRSKLTKAVKRKKPIQKIFVALTFDVEQDGGSRGRGEVSKVKPFLSNIGDILGKRRGTFFVQGNLVNRFVSELKSLASYHELGAHSWSHDRLWGNRVWFSQEKPLTIQEKRTHLQQIILTFEKGNLPKPHSFRAINLIIDEETLQCLSEFGFKVDSSWESFRDFRQPFKVGKLWEIPVSSLACPRRHLAVVPVYDYQVLNIANLKRLPDNIWQENLKQILEAQAVPHLVFMGHSWDFDAQVFNKFLNFIDTHWRVKYTTMQELARQL